MRTAYLLEKQVDRVFSALMPANRLVCKTCLRTGLRVSDVLTLRPDQIRQQVWVTESKTGKRKQIGFDAVDRAEILAQSSADWAFPGRDPRKHRTRQAVYRDLKRAAKAFRIWQNVGVHSLRKVYAVRLMHKYGELAKVRRALNHSSDAVTLIYAMADKLLEEDPRARRTATRS